MVGVMVCLCFSLSVCVCTMFVGATRLTHAVHRIHAVCVVKGVWNSCCETQRSSLLCPGSLWSDNRYLSTLLLFSFCSASFSYAYFCSAVFRLDVYTAFCIWNHCVILSSYKAENYTSNITICLCEKVIRPIAVRFCFFYTCISFFLLS